MKVPHYSYQILIILLIAVAYKRCHKEEPIDWTPTYKMSTPMPDYSTKFPPEYDSTLNKSIYNNQSSTTTEQEELIIRERIIVDKNGTVRRIKYIEP